ncbi:unnamed protein product [Psylliodes chrysocephalus]|uniref:Uncharacterized protein n=1 Tax=Psylliodes chrysocephalus TaxID=3402493 RepID=A0A9P0GCH4_9CUCU|nr:unnamed protein product [Psylliodes chrysocephala]
MTKMKVVFVFLGLLTVLASTLALDSNLHKNGPKLRSLYGPGAALEERQAHKSGILRILEEFVNVLQTILGFADGHNTLDDIVSSVQMFSKGVQGLVNVKAIIKEVPFIGPTAVWIISPVLDIFGQMVNNTPVFGGLLSQLVVGPSYPTQA